MSRHSRQGRHVRPSRYEEESAQQISNTTNNPFGNFNLNTIAGIVNSIDINALANAINKAGDDIDEQEERGLRSPANADIILALRTLINADKALLIQTVIQLFALSRNQKR
ncbi:hypothetical protein [Clostridium thermarum]|uniref:hypothetical protein n=1 Tax=Clostridium thermarum TaxID=1716543 RepID=UPI00111E4579|nr:hypothetical protein [Clostridium thermarum]